MTKLKLLLTASVVFLSGCDDLGYYRGVGFSGIDGEPKSIAQSDAEQGLVSRTASSSEALAGLPPVALQADATSLDQLAGAAISRGGRNFASAVPVQIVGQDLMMSSVQVNGILFAVLRTPEGNAGRMAGNTAAAFLNAVPALTGCLAGADAFASGSGSADNPSGLAVPLNCS